MMKITLCLILAIASMNGATIFGPVTYTRTTGAPNVYDTTFAAYDTTVLCTLVVANGDADGEHRLSSASIEFNGEEIVKERDFSESVETITRIIQLASENSLHLRLRSGPGDFLTMNIRRPCDAYVELAVDTVIDGEACLTATAGGWGNLTYSWDFDGDGAYDTTTTSPTICHTYEEADTYWASVRVEDKVGCEATDSAEVIIELGYHYTFQIDSSYTSWSWTFPASETLLVPVSFSDDGSVVIVSARERMTELLKDYYVFSKGTSTRGTGDSEDATLEQIISDVYMVNVNHSGDRIISAKFAPWDQDSGCSIYCLSLTGDTLWGPEWTRYAPVWSPNDSLIGTLIGPGKLDEMPGKMDYLVEDNQLDWGHLVKIFTKSGEMTDELPLDRYDYNYYGMFRNDLGAFIGYKLPWRDFPGDPPRYRPLWAIPTINDTLEIYDTRNGAFTLVNKIIPFVCNSYESMWAYTCPVATIAPFDHRIYASVGWSPDLHEGEYHTEYACFDSLGNQVWRDIDTTRAHARYYSESGRYLLEFKMGNPGVVTLRNTQDNEILFSKNYPLEGELFLAGLWEHPLTGNCLIIVMVKGGASALFYPDGTEANIDMLGLTLTQNPSFAYKVEGSTLTVYKVRW